MPISSVVACEILLGLNPKDFDAVTDAKPFEVKDIFGKRCRIIGRRFQLAHVYSGREMIEVATFRAPPNGNAHTTSDGMIVRDNVWGDIEQDLPVGIFPSMPCIIIPSKAWCMTFAMP